jgi:predicted transcriptional regulator
MTELRITIGEPFEAMLERAEAAEHAWRAGLVSEPAATHLNFGSWEQLTRTLTPKRLELLRYLHRSPAASVRALATTLGRAYANVHADVEALAEAGLIERDAEGLRADYDEITTRMAL